MLRSIGKKSINAFTSDDIKIAQKWAYKFYKALGVKSPFFRAWFEDWREYDHDKIGFITISSISIEDALRNMPKGTFSNSDAGWEISIGNLGRNDTFSHSGREKISVRMLSEIQNIIENGILLDTEVSIKNNTTKHYETAFMHKLYTPVKYDEKKYIAKISVEEYGSKITGKRFYNLRGIKIDLAGGISDTDASYDTMPDTRSINSISDLFDFVKTFDKDFKPKSVNEHFIDKETGQPKVFYLPENDGVDWSNGVTVYQNKRANAQPVYISSYFEDGANPNFEIKDNGDVIVYDAGQVKSAADGGNIGTFDRGSKKIRYSRKADTDSEGEKNADNLTDEEREEYYEAVRSYLTYLTEAGAIIPRIENNTMLYQKA